MNRIALLTTVSVLAVSAGLAAAADSRDHLFAGTEAPNVLLFGHNTNDAGVAVESTNFLVDDSYDDQAADDFVVPLGHVWRITEVDVTGHWFNQVGTSENVFFYKDNGFGLPQSGPAYKQCLNVPGVGSGSLVINIPKTCKIRLRPGTYWLSVQANGGDPGNNYFGWDWEMNSSVFGSQSAFRGGLYGPNCQVWNTTANCWGYPPNDLMFDLKGTST